MAVNSKVDLCNMAQNHLGNYAAVMNIDTPKTSAETTFAVWYDIARQDLLKTVIPNFAMARRIVSQSITAPIFDNFGYGFAYEYPSDCLKLLGIGDADQKENNYSVENNYIYTDMDYTTTGLPIRFIRDVKEVNSMSPEFKHLMAIKLASVVAMPLTQQLDKKKLMEQLLSQEMSRISGLNAQENRPIRISYSRFKAARNGFYAPSYQNKK